nr:MAG TPA: hypothetical protein [Caudoviricetes sp.]
MRPRARTHRSSSPARTWADIRRQRLSRRSLRRPSMHICLSRGPRSIWERRSENLNREGGSQWQRPEPISEAHGLMSSLHSMG